MMNKKDSTDERNKDKNRDKPEAQSTSTKLTKKMALLQGTIMIQKTKQM